MLGRYVARFIHNKSGGVALMTGLLALPLVGAIGLGVDMYRLQNAATALDHVTGLTCDRVAEADTAIYPGATGRKEMGLSFAAESAKRTDLDPKRSAFTVEVTQSSVGVTGTTSLDATFMSAFGYKTLSKTSQRTCPIDTPTTVDKPGCPLGTLIFTNTAQLTTTISSMSTGATAYVASVIAPDGAVRQRTIFGRNQANSTGFIAGVRPDDYIIFQRMRADGTVPAACSPVRCPNCPPPNCTNCPPAPPPTNVCPVAVPNMKDVDGAGELRDDRSVPNPALAAMATGSAIRVTASNGTVVSIPITQPFDSTAPATQYLAGQMTWLNIMADMATGRSGPLKDTMATFGNRARLYRIVQERDSIWEIDGQCVYVTSPIVLDLPGLGHIATTGLTSGRLPIPQPLTNWRWFDLYGTGTLVRSEWIVGNGQGLLVDNRDGAAAEDMSGKRLFGTVGGFANGYEKLATLDADGDGRITGAELDGLAIWLDDGDAAVGAGELRSLAELQVTELSVRMQETPGPQGAVHMRSTAVRNGETIMTEDVWFNANMASDIVATRDARAPAK